MRGFSDTKMLNSNELELMGKAARYISIIPSSIGFRCREVSRAIGYLLNLQVQDGHYGLVEHSWLWLQPWTWGTHPPSILDPYVIEYVPKVRIVEFNPSIRDLYNPRKDPYVINQNMVNTLIREMQKIDSKQGELK